MTEDVRTEIDAFIEEQRATCLWSVARTWAPTTDEERRHMLDRIARNGSLSAFKRATQLQRCL